MKEFEIVHYVKVPKSGLVKSGNNYAIANTQVCNEIYFVVDELLGYIDDPNVKLTINVYPSRYSHRYEISVKGELEE
jgi:hypothetical protein